MIDFGGTLAITLVHIPRLFVDVLPTDPALNTKSGNAVITPIRAGRMTP